MTLELILLVDRLPIVGAAYEATARRRVALTRAGTARLAHVGSVDGGLQTFVSV